MKLSNTILGLSLLVGGVLAGCGDSTDMTKAELDKAKTGAAPMTDAQKAAVADTMAKGGAAAANTDQAWAKANPDKLPAVNASRAKRGLPPLGTGN